ncbi:alpha/beta fold hydrolase [Flavobacterium cerinum]|uniref:Alpha/beta hydrolase n=1 Tax=Flavobacterium cerinum TaxID=2502784 RepID=A0ABY5IPT9_9FLAO|nr:alpha/beta hydrolase [Flavobacterium cerinum]UUC44815.1 alpha/beta hydrolase [Flavobacterium cerinum]
MPDKKQKVLCNVTEQVMRLNFKILNLSILFFTISNLVSCQSKIQNGNYYEKIGDLKLNYTIRGKGPILIVGHLNSGKIGYELTLKPLESDFTIVYYEPRGTGKSETPKTIEEYNQDYIVQEIEDLRKKLNVDKIWIFGHSDQSSIALEYALKFPQSTSGLILTGTSLVGTQQETFERRKKAETQRAEESAWFSQVIKDWDYMMTHKTQTNEIGKDISDASIKWWCYNEESAQKVIPIAKEILKAGRRKPIKEVYPIETEAEREKYLDYQKKFPNIKTTILIVNGKYDTNNPPKYADELNKVLPNSKLVLIDKAGHFPWIENSEKTFQEIENWIKIVK